MKITKISCLLVTVGLVCACGGAKKAPAGDSSEIESVVLGKRKKFVPAPAMPGVNVPAIKVNTVGYAKEWPKLAMFNVDPKGAVIKDEKGKVVYEIADDKVVDMGVDNSSKDPVWQVDFSDFDKDGKYTLQVGDAASDPFVIGPAKKIYKKALVAGQKFFYFQRTRTALVEPYATWEGTSFLREGVSHAHDQVGWDADFFPEKKKRWKVEGGWFDAGNFDMYIPSTAPSAKTLLLAYEWAPDLFADKDLNIPESGNGIPDILDEAKWGLVWILSLQEKEGKNAGAFRHGETVEKDWPEGPADMDKNPRWITTISTAATAKAVSVLALASRLYAKHDPKFAERCKTAAKAGWEFLKKHPDQIRGKNVNKEQPLWDDGPAEDGTNNMNNEIGARFNAAVEMWHVFDDKDGLDHAKKVMKQNPKEMQTDGILYGAWSNLSRYGLARLAMADKTPAKVKADAKKLMVETARLMIDRIEKEDGYRCANGYDDYYWASNSNLMERLYMLAVAAKLEPENESWQKAARDQWHWILGRNPNGYSMVTRVGKGPDRLYHGEWGSHEPPPPGYLLDGPNGAGNGSMSFLAPDAPAKALLWDNPTELRSGLPPHSLWHCKQSDLWDSGAVAEGEWSDGWWGVTEPDILYSANFVLAAVVVH